MRIDAERCDLCGRCVATCPERALSIESERLVFEPPCVGCGHCEAVCPKEAIALGAGPLEPAPKLPEGATEQIDLCIRTRRSVRKYKPAPVEREIMEELLELAVRAPNSANDQVWEFAVVQDPETLRLLRDRISGYYKSRLGLMRHRRLARLLMRLMGHCPDLVDNPHIRNCIPKLVEFHESGEDMLTVGAPALIIGHAPPSATNGRADCIYAMATLMLAAHARGIGTCALGWVQDALAHDRRARDVVRIAPGRLVHTTIAIGYPDEEFLRIPSRKPPIVHWL